MVAKQALLLAVLLLLCTPVITATRSVECDVDQRDSRGEMYVRYQQCLVDSNGNHTEITMVSSSERWVLDPPRAEKKTTVWSWWDGAWYRTESQDRILWSGTVKTDQLVCRFGGKSRVRYVFSDDTAICLLR